MHIDDCASAFQFFENGLQCRVSEVHAVRISKENKTLEPEDVEGVGEFL
jgi:hypothetical protein